MDSCCFFLPWTSLFPSFWKQEVCGSLDLHLPKNVLYINHICAKTFDLRKGRHRSTYSGSSHSAILTLTILIQEWVTLFLFIHSFIVIMRTSATLRAALCPSRGATAKTLATIHTTSLHWNAKGSEYSILVDCRYITTAPEQKVPHRASPQLPE